MVDQSWEQSQCLILFVVGRMGAIPLTHRGRLILGITKLAYCYVQLITVLFIFLCTELDPTLLRCTVMSKLVKHEENDIHIYNYVFLCSTDQ
jgi:hypothetical protein